MKIYFAGSIRGGRDDAYLYRKIIDHLKNFGEVLTEHIGDPYLTDLGDDGPSDRFIHDRDMNWLISADMMVAEVTTASLGVGYEIGSAVAMGKKILCLYRPEPHGRLSAMIAGCPEITLKNYNSLDEAMNIMSDYMNQE